MVAWNIPLITAKFCVGLIKLSTASYFCDSQMRLIAFKLVTFELLGTLLDINYQVLLIDSIIIPFLVVR